MIVIDYLLLLKYLLFISSNIFIIFNFLTYLFTLKFEFIGKSLNTTFFNLGFISVGFH